MVCLLTDVDRICARFRFPGCLRTLSPSPFPASHSAETRARNSRIEVYVFSPTTSGVILPVFELYFSKSI